MAKIKIKLTLFFSLCFLAAVVFCDGSSDSDPSENPNPNPNPNLSPVEYFAKYFQALEDRNRELEKSQEEIKDLKTSYEKSHAELKQKVESLEEEMKKLKQGISEDHGVWLLTPPLRGPQGKKGENGEQGQTGPKGDRGEKGEKGPLGPSGSNGTPGPIGLKGDRGEKGEKGPVGPGESKGDQGISGMIEAKTGGSSTSKGDSTTSDAQSITSCSIAMEILPSPRSKKQVIYPHGNSTSLEVLCDFENDGGGWTLIQKRSSGPKEEFNQTWNEYEKGFGSLTKNFWLGLDNIRTLTKNGDQELRIDLEDFEGNKRYAKYSSFSVLDASDFYRLSISGYSGDAGNDMNSTYSTWVHNGMRFSTKDKDNTPSSSKCAASYPGGWWFNNCFAANLNGLYREKGETVPSWQGIIWNAWKGDKYSLAKTEMKIRKRK